ncbi:MAG: HAMP domain-containing histidine kinase [Vampirovibrio sp.]
MSWSFLKSKPWGLRRKTTGFRFYQQIIILVLLIVTIPLGGLSIWLYDINDSALRKQIAGTEEDVLRATLKNTWQEIAFRQEEATLLLNWFHRDLMMKDLDRAVTSHILNMDPSLQFVGICEQSKPSLRQWSSRLSPPPQIRQHLTAWACEAQAPKGLPQHRMIPRWGSPSEKPQWLRSVYSLGDSRQMVQVHALTQLDALWSDLLHLQRAGVWLALPQTNAKSSIGTVFYLQESSNGGISFKNAEPPLFVMQTLKRERAKIPTTQQNLSWTGIKHENRDYLLAEMKPLGAWLVVSPDWHENRHFIKQARLKTFAVIGFSLLLSVLIGTGYVLGIVRNFRQLIKGIKAMGEGSYGRQIRLITNWVTPFEIRYLTAEVNRMSRQLEKQVTTIQNANQQLAKLDELKSTLIDTVSHELRTPLMNIQGYTNRLLKHRDHLSDEQEQQALTIIKQQCKRLNRLVEDLLVIPDLENHQLRVYCEAHSLARLWKRLLPLLSESVQNALVVEFPSSEHLEETIISVEEDRWQQVLVNLLENAAKYRHSEEDSITLRLHETVDLLQIEISNPSDPITEEQLTQLFDKFHRLDDGLTRRTRGSGLGLFIAKALTEAMGGDLRLTYEAPYFSALLSFPRQVKSSSPEL